MDLAVIICIITVVIIALIKIIILSTVIYNYNSGFKKLATWQYYRLSNQLLTITNEKPKIEIGQVE